MSDKRSRDLSDPSYVEPCNHEVGRTITCRLGTYGCSIHPAESPAPPVPDENVTELLTTLMSEVLYFREMKRWSPGHEKVFREVTDYLNSKVKYVDGAAPPVREPAKFTPEADATLKRLAAEREPKYGRRGRFSGGPLPSKADEVQGALVQAWAQLKYIEKVMGCPCGARGEALDTHPHVGGCGIARLLELAAEALKGVLDDDSPTSDRVPPKTP